MSHDSHLPPLETRKTLRMRIVIAAKAEFTMPRPTSPSAAAASPARPGSVRAWLFSASVIWKSSSRLRSVSEPRTASWMSAAYSGALSIRSRLSRTTVGTMIARIPAGIASIPR
jgi:hypothetical protein